MVNISFENQNPRGALHLPEGANEMNRRWGRRRRVMSRAIWGVIWTLALIDFGPTVYVNDCTVRQRPPQKNTSDVVR